MRDPHEPVVPGQHVHPAQGHGGESMPIGVSGQESVKDVLVSSLLEEGVKIAEELIGAAVEKVSKKNEEPPLDEQLAESPSEDSGTEAQAQGGDVSSGS